MILGSRFAPQAPSRDLACLALASLVVAGCATPQGPSSVTELLSRPAERHLLAGLRQYDDAQYAEAEAALNEALKLKLASPKDRANAHKTLAFILCTTARPLECEAEFRAARAADRGFSLSRAEAGHPVWGPVYEASRR